MPPVEVSRGQATGARARLHAAFVAHRATLAVFASAFAIRAVWNLVYHPPLAFGHSDMGGYLRRAGRVLEGPIGEVDPWLAFFPWGTHAIIAAVQGVFGRQNAPALGVAFALMGALAVTYGHAFFRRLAPAHPRLHVVFAIVMCCHISHVLLGSFALSEVPFSFALTATAFHALRFDDDGRARDALYAGLFASLGAVVRPQILLSLALLAAVLIVRRVGRAPIGARPSPRAALLFAVPLAVTLGLSAMRVHHHVGRWELVSTNGDFNRVFGRCHASRVESSDRRGVFELPPLKSLENFEAKYRIRPILPLDPAITPTIRLEGRVWDDVAANQLADDCVERTGWWRQVKYAATHVILLWEYNIPWPTAGFVASVGSSATWLVLPGLLITPLLAIARPRGREVFAAVHVLALLLTAIVYFGDSRLRVPYDGFIVALALLFYCRLFERVRAWSAARARPPLPATTAGSGASAAAGDAGPEAGDAEGDGPSSPRGPASA